MLKKFRHFLEYLFFQFMGFWARILPLRWALAVGSKIGIFGYYCVPIRKDVTLQNLRDSFPEKTEAERVEIAKQVYRNLGINAMEHLRFPSMSPQDLLGLVEFENLDIFKTAWERGKGVIISGGHFGNWEVMGCSISASGFPTSFVVADIHNRFLDKMINDHRKSMGVTIIPKGMAIRGILQELRSNRCVALLMDQDAGKSGSFVNFFNRQASTPKGPAKFALKTGAALMLSLSFRKPDGSLRVVFEEICTNDLNGASEENIQIVTQRATTRLEERIREYPDHWFWMHKRWKTKPEAQEKI